MITEKAAPILVLGGDGYLGWPLALKLAKAEPERQIIIADNLTRRRLAKQLGNGSLTPIGSPADRVAAARNILGLTNLEYLMLDVNSDSLQALIGRCQPAAIYHLAQQCSAPLSMRSMEDALFTLRNNEEGNMRLLWAVKEHAPDCHIIKLGTFGEYAKSGLDIAEGYFTPSYKGKTAQRPIPYPRQSDDFYHASKINDTNYLSIAARMWNLRITDVMQSTIFGVWTDETAQDPTLCTRLDYDEYFGTVLNRFLTQAMSGSPLTVYGSGHQRTGLMSLNDSAKSMANLWHSAPEAGQHRVINHLTEQSFSINELADTVQHLLGEMGFAVAIQRGAHDPRQEQEQSKLAYQVERHYLDQHGQHESLEQVVRKSLTLLLPYKDNIDRQRFAPQTQWAGATAATEPQRGEVISLRGSKQHHSDEASWETFRSKEFPHTQLNLSPGALGNPSTTVLNAMQRFNSDDKLANPLSQYGAGRSAMIRALDRVKTLWPSDRMQAQVCASASQCSNLLALNLARQAAAQGWKMRVLTTPHEHIGGTGAFEKLPEFDVSYLSPEEINDPDAFAECLRQVRPDVAFFSHIAYDNGYIFPVEKWAEQIKATYPECCVIVDISQSLGVQPPPLAQADVVFGSAHKWLFGPRGSGLIWTTPDFRERTEALNWSGAALNTAVGASGFSPSGGMDFSVFSGLEAALKLYQQVGPGTIRQRGRLLAGRLRQGLSELLDSHGIDHSFISKHYKLDYEAGVIAVSLPDYDPYPLYQALHHQGLHCKCIKDQTKTGQPRMLLRFGVPYYETETRVEQALSIIEHCIKSVALSVNPSLSARVGSH